MSIKILSPCGILGYGFPSKSFENGLKMKPDAIIVDAGSTDAGPHKLGAGVAIVSKQACKKDLQRLILGSRKLDIPCIIGSAGGSGAKVHVDWTMDIVNEIIAENKIENLKIAVISADIPKDLILKKMDENKVTPLGDKVPFLDSDSLKETNTVVAQMGMEPILEALENGANLIICGRAYDPSPFAAFGVFKGCSKALSYHLGKILECGALCCDPGTTKDCMMGEIYDDYFDVYSLDERRSCSTVSVAAHTFYEKDHPFLLHGPGIVQNLEDCDFSQISSNRVRVSNSKLEETEQYSIKLEGAKKVAYRTFVIAGVRDPLLIERIEEVEQLVKESIWEQYSEIDRDDYTINFINYGKNGVMGELETESFEGYEIGVLFEVLSKTQKLSSAICASCRSTFLHYGYEDRKSTAGNLAFPFAPSDVEFGAVYAFSVYHLMEVDDPKSLFPIKYIEVENE
jgi:hypothetical protein